jgi:hypothetical protein
MFIKMDIDIVIILEILFRFCEQVASRKKISLIKNQSENALRFRKRLSLLLDNRKVTVSRWISVYKKVTGTRIESIRVVEVDSWRLASDTSS